MLQVVDHSEGIVFSVVVQPRSSKNSVAGLYDGALKIKLTAPPVDNAANKMCVGFLSKLVGVSKSSIEIVSGHTNRRKQILIKLDPNQSAALKKRIQAFK